MHPALREALSRVVTRAVGSPFAKPIARLALAVAGLVLLAFIGRSALAGAIGAAQPAATTSQKPATPDTASASAENRLVPSVSLTPLAPAATPQATSFEQSAGPAEVSAAPRTRASSDDPVVLNTADVGDLRRLPGIGEKRANAILALRGHLGRFRAVEDLLKVKGIGRAMLKRLRPLVRLDAPPLRDAGPAAPR